MHNHGQNRGARLSVDALQYAAVCAGDELLDVRQRNAGQQVDEVVLCFVEEDSARNGETECNAAQLAFSRRR